MNKIPYGRQTILQEDIDAVVSVLQSDYLTQGPEIKQFEEAVAAYHDSKYAVAFSSGTAALHAAYHSMGVKDGDEVITSPMTFAATANGAVYCGGIPVFADIDPATNCIDPACVERKISKKTKVISPIAYAGYPVDLAEIHRIAKENNCRVLYDAAHAIGSRRNGTFGMEFVDAAMLSFHPVKHVAAGEGGIILTNDDDIYRELCMFRTHGITKDPTLLEKNDGPWYYEMQSLGFNYRITDMQCALANSQFARIKGNLRRRNEIANRYDDSFRELGWINTPPNVGFQSLESESWEDIEDIHSYHLYTLALSDPATRRSFYDYLHEHGILAQIHYVPVHLQPYYRKTFGCKAGDCPVAEDFYAREISIPMFHGMKDDQVDYVIDVVKKFK